LVRADAPLASVIDAYERDMRARAAVALEASALAAQKLFAL